MIIKSIKSHNKTFEFAHKNMRWDSRFAPAPQFSISQTKKMKKEFETLKDRLLVSIVLTRDSVCAGGDVDAPHEKTIKIRSFIDPEALANVSTV